MQGLALLMTILVALAGCSAGARMTQADQAAGYAAPGPDLVGTWRGTAFAAPGSLYGTSTPVEVAVGPDGTWSWSKRGQEQARGNVHVRGDRVFLVEDVAKEGAQTIQLSRRGDHLWGLTGAFIPGFPAAVDLRREGS